MGTLTGFPNPPTGSVQSPPSPTRSLLLAEALDKMVGLNLDRGRPLAVRQVGAPELERAPAVRGGISLQLDLVFRSSVSPDEILFTAERGLVLVAEHPDLPDVPVGAMLVMPSMEPVERRADLFTARPELTAASALMPFAVAANPRGLGAGGLLVQAALAAAAALAARPRVVTFSPMTGLRAHVVRVLDDPSAAVPEPARAQLLSLLEAEALPDAVPEPAAGFLRAEAARFAASREYAVGNFHRGQGATLAGIREGADPRDVDALFFRCWFDYGRRA